MRNSKNIIIWKKFKYNISFEHVPLQSFIVNTRTLSQDNLNKEFDNSLRNFKIKISKPYQVDVPLRIQLEKIKNISLVKAC